MKRKILIAIEEFAKNSDEYLKLIDKLARKGEIPAPPGGKRILNVPIRINVN